jgi:hypothetical protein
MSSFRFTTELPRVGDSRILVVEVPKNVDSKVELLSFLAVNLRFPDHFGRNWDALDECLSDLSWLDVDRIVFWHNDVPLLHGSTDRKAYLELLNGLCKEELRKKIEVIFPIDKREEVELVLARS